MTLYYISYSFITKIAKAVKSKLGISDKIKVSEIPDLIYSIKGGNDKTYIEIPNKLANKFETIYEAFTCVKKSEKYDITVIKWLTPPIIDGK